MLETDVKRAVDEYLTILRNQGKLWFERLNSGSLLAKKGDRVYRVQLCEEGTADFEVSYWAYPKGAPNKGEVIVWWLECKASNGKQSQEQKAFQKIVELQHHNYMIVRSVDDIAWLGE